ncbi:hypothetical protein Y032_0213g2302 [Ancylostoma ceylanicum]|uniref:Uncharacterized protein n=1 Tax=Ancylostoma ceylanicum TaxID=53326 RepID=A0A016SKM4_9BILA|nr:hypothetical protein Y032_0213g2302 [Ancylostoma ceylanicum]
MNEGVSGVKEASSTDGRVDEAADSQSIVIMAGLVRIPSMLNIPSSVSSYSESGTTSYSSYFAKSRFISVTILVVRWDITTDPIFLSIATIDLFVILSSITLSWTRTMLRIYPALWGKPLYQNVSLDSSAKEIYLPSLLPLELNNRIHVLPSLSLLLLLLLLAKASHLSLNSMVLLLPSCPP